MSIVTAVALFGSVHPNDGGLIPAFNASLYEGHTAKWVVREIETGIRLMSKEPEHPEKIIHSLIQIKEFLRCESVAISIFPDSSLLLGIDELKNLLSANLVITTPIYERSYSQWK